VKKGWTGGDLLHYAADRASASAVATSEPSRFWAALIDRPEDFLGSGATACRHYVLKRASATHEPAVAPLLRLEADLLARILGGEQGKAAAIELGIAPSTVSKWYCRALCRFGLSRRNVPLTFVLAAHSWASRAPLPIDTRHVMFDQGGERFALLSAPKPCLESCSFLTDSERYIAGRLLEGDHPSQIALFRGTSRLTVASQFGPFPRSAKPPAGLLSYVAQSSSDGSRDVASQRESGRFNVLCGQGEQSRPNGQALFARRRDWRGARRPARRETKSF
jgi:DNA-binding CsgD family transcriptional regulator